MEQKPEKGRSLKSSKEVLSLKDQIKEMKMAEKVLRESEERFRAAHEASIDGFLIFIPKFDHEGSIADFVFAFQNAASAKMNGTTPEGVIGKGVLELFPGLKDTIFFQTYKKVFESKQTAEFEEHYQGETIIDEKWFRIVVVPAGDGIAVHAQDITEKKKAEKARLESEEKLLEAQSLAHMCSFIFDFEQNSCEWTEEFLNIFEIDSQGEYPSIEQLMELVHPEDRNYVLQSVKHAVENKMGSLQMDYRIVTGKGNLKYVNYRGKLSYNEKGQITKRFGTIMDVTERKLRELELRKTLGNLERSNRDLEQFAYVASHDLQEPLRMISIYSTMLERKLQGTLDDEKKQYLDILIESSRRMHSLITGLLEYSRISSKKEDPIHVDMNNLVSEVLKDLIFSLNQTNAEVIAENLPNVKANPVEMKMLMQNLISNAIKFTVKGVRPCIEIKGERKEGYVVYSVKDNGIGISPEDYERIFVLFHRLHAREVYSGTGIGLAICKRIVESQGGSIWVESEEGKGAAFYLSFPD